MTFVWKPRPSWAALQKKMHSRACRSRNCITLLFSLHGPYELDDTRKLQLGAQVVNYPPHVYTYTQTISHTTTPLPSFSTAHAVFLIDGKSLFSHDEFSGCWRKSKHSFTRGFALFRILSAERRR